MTMDTTHWSTYPNTQFAILVSFVIAREYCLKIDFIELVQYPTNMNIICLDKPDK